MSKMLKLFFALSLMVLVSAPLHAQDGPSGTITISLANDPTSLYMPRTADITATNAALPLYDALVWTNEDGELVPWLAESWAVSDDGTEYTFYLREGITFHNGEPFTAEAVIATWEMGKDPSNDYANLYEDVTSVEAIDDYTVRIVAAEPDGTFLNRVLEDWAIVPPEYIREVGIDEFEDNPVGTGPFRFVERVSGDRVVYEANPDYWQEGMPRVERVVFRVIPDSSTRIAAVQTGEIDVANRLTPDQARTLEGHGTVDIVTYLNDRVYYVGFKNVGAGEGSPLEDRDVRLALNYAVNRQGIIDAIFAGAAEPVTGFILPTNLGHDDSLEPYPYDPERAREMLAAAGYEDGFEISMGCPADAYVNINEVCLAVQRNLQDIGVEVAVEFLTTTTYWAEPQYGATGEMYVDSWSSGIGEAMPRLIGALIPGQYYNTWVDEELETLIRQAEATVDRDERAAIYREIQHYMYEDPSFIYLYQPLIFEAVNQRVQNYQPRANEEIHLNEVSVQD